MTRLNTSSLLGFDYGMYSLSCKKFDLFYAKDLTVVRLLAEKTKEVDVVAHSYATAGEIVPLTALLIVAVDKIREASVALQDVDDSVWTKPKTTIYEFVILEALRSNSKKRMLLLREIGLLQLFGAAVFSESVDKQTSPLFSIVQVRLGDFVRHCYEGCNVIFHYRFCRQEMKLFLNCL